MSTPAQRRPPLRLVAGEAEPISHARPRTPVPPSRDDTELLTALRRGDPTAATTLHDRVRPQVDRTLRRLLGRDDVDHEDVAQQALIELVYTIDRYRGECSLDAWVATITAHAIYKHIRRRRTERRLFSALSPEHLNVVANTGLTSRDTSARSALSRVLAHLDEIEEGRAWAYLLHDVCGYDLREISQITGATIAAAQSRLVRGRRDVHEKIQNDPELSLVLDNESGQ